MFLPESDVSQWKEDLKRHDFQRKNGAQEAAKTQFAKPVTWRDVKQKEAEYHPILQKFSQAERENNTRMMESDAWKHKADVQRKTIEKYIPEYNIINLEKDQTVAERGTRQQAKPRQQLAAQANYNIITNQDFAGGQANSSDTPTKSMKKAQGTLRDFNIISNQYLAENDRRQEDDKRRVERDIHARYIKTHDYNIVAGEYYDKTKEDQYQEKRVKAQKDHGKDANDKLPPTIKNRETIIFDPTREVPEAIKVLDQKKKDAMKKYEVRYKVENQMKERDIAQQDRAEEMKMKRIYDKKFTEHIDKGFDILTMDDYDKSKLSYVPKPSNTKWEKLRLTSNNSTQAQPFTKVTSEKSPLHSSNLRQPRLPEQSLSSPAVRGTSLPTWHTHSSEIINPTTDFNRMKEYKTAYQRAKEPVYNLADKYNQYCVKPSRVVDDFNTRTLPQIKVADASLKFSMGQTGTFKRADATAQYREN